MSCAGQATSAAVKRRKIYTCGAAGACTRAFNKVPGSLARIPQQARTQCSKCNRIFCGESCHAKHTDKCTGRAGATDFADPIDDSKQWLPLRTTGVGIRQGKYTTAVVQQEGELPPGPKSSTPNIQTTHTRCNTAPAVVEEPPTANDLAAFVCFAGALGTSTVAATLQALDQVWENAEPTMSDCSITSVFCKTCKTDQRIAAFVHTNVKAVVTPCHQL